MSWVSPKTDWVVHLDENGNYTGDYFEATDYQRIKGNLEYLFDLAESVGLAVDRVSIPNITSASFATIGAINALERSLDSILLKCYDPGVPDRKTWLANNSAPKAEDLNRIENSCLMLYNVLVAQANAQPRLPFTLGGVQFGK